MDKLKGIFAGDASKKTYITAAALALIAALKHLQVIDDATGNLIMELLIALGLVTLRAGVDKSGVK